MVKKIDIALNEKSSGETKYIILEFKLSLRITDKLSKDKFKK
jgi:hypothetical protein